MLRGTVYQIFENDEGECVDMRRDVVSYSVETPAEFKQRALDDVQGSHLPGHEADVFATPGALPPRVYQAARGWQRVEFGSIGPRWPIR
jgi:hypothetical protein